MNIITEQGFFMHKQIMQYKRQLIKEIRAILKPKMWESGFIKNPFPRQENEERKYLKVYVWPARKNGDPIIYKNQKFEFEIEGFTEEGVITDSYSTIATKDFNEFHYEEIVWIHKIASEKVK